MIIVSTWKFLGFGMDLYRYKMGTIDRNVGHAALQVVSGPNKGVYISWWPSGKWAPDKLGRYAGPHDIATDFSEEAWNRRNQMSDDYQRFVDALEKISTQGGADAALAKNMFDMIMDGDSEERKVIKFRPPSENFHIPSQADGELFGLDDKAIVAWWGNTLAALKKASTKRLKDRSTYYDLMTNNCSDAIILALGAGMGRLDETGAIKKDTTSVPREFPEVPDIKTKVQQWVKADLPTFPPDFDPSKMTPEQGMKMAQEIEKTKKLFITPDAVEEKARAIMMAIGKMQTAYKEALKKIPTDKKVELLPVPKSDQFDKIDEKLAAAHLDPKAVKLVEKALADYKDVKTTKGQDTVILAEMLIDLAEFLPAKPGADKSGKVNWDVVYEFANQTKDTVDQLLKENAAEVKQAVDKAAKTLWG